MSQISNNIRLSRILRNNGRTLIVAMDHPIYFWAHDPPGLSNPADVMKSIIAGGADAILASPGVIQRYGAPSAKKLGMIATIPPDPKMIKSIAKLGADAIKTTHFLDPKVIREAETSDMILRVSFQCQKWGIPFLCEIVPRDQESGELILDPDEIAVAVRVAAEAGADLVKTVYPGSVEDFRKVLSISPVPVVILGGAKAKDERALLTMVKDSIDAGGAGVAMGRNIWKYSDPAKLVRAIIGIIHEGKTVDQALQELK